jgi:hypothetical protein
MAEITGRDNIKDVSDTTRPLISASFAFNLL